MYTAEVECSDQRYSLALTMISVSHLRFSEYQCLVTLVVTHAAYQRRAQLGRNDIPDEFGGPVV